MSRHHLRVFIAPSHQGDTLAGTLAGTLVYVLPGPDPSGTLLAWIASPGVLAPGAPGAGRPPGRWGESEMELAYAGLHQLCAPLLDRLDRLPLPQRDALATVFGRSAGPAPHRFLVGLATLTLLAEVKR